MSSTAWKKPKYGWAKPVKQPKPSQSKKPSVLELKAILKTIHTATNGLHLDSMSHALYWWHKALPYIKAKRPHETLEQTRALLAAFDWTKKGQQASDNKEKERCFISALDMYRKYGKSVISTPPVTPYLKEMRGIETKLKDTNKKLDARYNKLTTLLSQCFSSVPFDFKVVPQCFSLATNLEVPMRIDHGLNILFISKSRAVRLLKDIRKQGLLPVAIEEGYSIARLMSFIGVREGKFLVDMRLHLQNYHDLMRDVAKFAASNPDAPRQLVKKTFAKKKKV